MKLLVLISLFQTPLFGADRSQTNNLSPKELCRIISTPDCEHPIWDPDDQVGQEGHGNLTEPMENL